LEQKLDIKYDVFSLYNQDLTNTEQAISKYLSNPMNTGGHRFSNIQVSLPAAFASDLLVLSVDPKNNSFTLVYYAEPGTLTGNVDSASLQMTFDMVLTMNFTTRGAPAPGNGPIALTSATVAFTNAMAQLSGFGVTLDDQLKLQQTFNTTQADATAIIQGLLAKSPEVAFLNAELISYGVSTGKTYIPAIVSPFFDASIGMFDLLVTSASTAPTATAAPALAQAGSQMSTPTILASSASPVSSQEPKHAFVAHADVPVPHGAADVNSTAEGKKDPGKSKTGNKQEAFELKDFSFGVENPTTVG
jgi:hypothetical protein